MNLAGVRGHVVVSLSTLGGMGAIGVIGSFRSLWRPSASKVSSWVGVNVQKEWRMVWCATQSARSGTGTGARVKIETAMGGGAATSVGAS